ncbi:Redoxin [Enhydrobacter aerosaccus]|uniref:Glutathione-dependent peroxiredoxin n=1 Tax=Enhydrobacter aerosaccus TaxID=225324 RepID=A0A1T4SWR1_9HYPH|nr:Redoxin [Enhydrobacter aerosaccus]
MPGFLANIDAIKAKGVDTVACISVNDAFVMGAWGKDQKVGDKILMLADGNAEFTHAMGLTLDASRNGLGTRSQRYAMVVDDGVIKDLLVEKPGAFEASAAENVLKHL